jgi:NADPH-dependent 2,4-dienoyl-CoA reductase/sulfur reductase-like enzyme
MGRALIADPELSIKAFEGRLEEIRPCTACNLGCNERMYLQLDISCQTNPMVGRERDFGIEPAAKKKKVLVIGGGPAGLETARVAALRGHEVSLFEKGKRLGGQLNLASMPPGKTEYEKLVNYYEYQMKKLKVKVVHRALSKGEIVKAKPDVIIFATGGKSNTGKGIAINSSSVFTAWDVLRGGERVGEKIVIVGGGQVGCETAHFLLDQGKRITILEMLEDVATDMNARARKVLFDELIKGGVEIIKQALVVGIFQSEITFERLGLKQKIKDFDHAVLALGTLPERSLLEELGEVDVPVFSIGDCLNPRKAIEAIREGFDLALEI